MAATQSISLCWHGSDKVLKELQIELVISGKYETISKSSSSLDEMCCFSCKLRALKLILNTLTYF